MASGIRQITTSDFNSLYQEIDYVAEGGSSWVGRYLDLRANVEVAIKNMAIYSEKIIEQNIKDATNEYNCLQQLQGIAGIPSVYDIFIVVDLNGKMKNICLVMELITDIFQLEDIQNFTHEMHRFVPWLLNMISLIHDRNVVHLDLQLHNILMNENHQFFLIDFGSGSYLGHGLPSVYDNLVPEVKIAELNETPLEFLDLKAIDIYYIGMMIYKLCGYGTWISRSEEETNIKLEQVNQTIYDPLIISCLQYNPEMRPDSMQLRELALRYQ